MWVQHRPFLHECPKLTITLSQSRISLVSSHINVMQSMWYTVSSGMSCLDPLILNTGENELLSIRNRKNNQAGIWHVLFTRLTLIQAGIRKLHPSNSVVRSYLSIPKHASFDVWDWISDFNQRFTMTCNYLSMLELMLIHVSGRGLCHLLILTAYRFQQNI